MGKGFRALDARTRSFFGGPGVALFVVVAAFFFIAPGIGKAAGLDALSIALFFVGLAVCIIAVSRVCRRLRKSPS
ncbi:hypothetical protein A2J03_02975 [Rhodococcus sp. EPR-157]|uniref:hypothetical protein n=1 Tax=Rhodococcus sp. EPR-157 TaxID=1813677 RepID=UPI0007BBF14A|nr:hypothetical protein [Rhodococcus sp. EPR-157]KZF09253.1 hypothetical protein A2J03_02975 [Rhodococcus sp. EPR-157]